ncbi:MAG: hypothetical protein ABIA59_04035 [Candidatus Latescibacterota bacterium]
MSRGSGAIGEKARIAFLLGSGLGGTVDGFPVRASVSFEDIAGVTLPEVAGHRGELRLCRMSAMNSLFVLGRKHHYEAADDEIYRIIRYCSTLGAEKLLVVSSAGSLNRRLIPGEFVLADRVLDLQARPPIPSGRGRSLLHLDKKVMQRIRAAAARRRIRLALGTVACMDGPAYETAAEVRYLQNIGADIAAMSGAPELHFANHLGMRAAVLCLITNYATSLSAGSLGHSEVLAMSGNASAALSDLLTEFSRDE